MKLTKRQVLLPGARKVDVLLPETICSDITITDDSKGNCYLMSNGTGYIALTDIFALATSLENDEIIYYPLAFAHIDAYKQHFSELENHYKGIVIFNFNTTKISAKDISIVLKTKIYEEKKLTRQAVFSKEYPDRWNTRHKLTVKNAGRLLIISGEREVFTSMAQSCANLSKYGDDAKYNKYPAHEHHDWDENTAKSIGITFYYWHSKDCFLRKDVSGYMTERNFSQALRRGLGRAIIELKENPNRVRYRGIVLRYCLRDISYDWQSEGTKGYYLYLAIRALDDKDYFEKIIIDKFMSRCPDRIFLQLSAILSCYANDGSEAAKEAFHMKYSYFVAKNGRLVKNRSVDEGFQWDEVVFQLFNIDGFSAFKRYATDIGKILLSNPNNRTVYDDWFISRAKNTFGKKKIDAFLENAYKKSDAIRVLLDTLKADADSREQYQLRTEQERITVEDLLRTAKEAVAEEYPRAKIARLRRSFFANASDAEMLELAQAALYEESDTVKALLLHVFWLKPFPLDIAPLIEYAQSDNELLAEAAIDRLKEFKDKRIHDLAVRLLKERGLSSMALALLKENYSKDDDSVITNLIKKSSSIPHHVQQDIRDIYCRHRSANALPILLRVYQKGDCSYCRSGIVEAMHHCKVLPDGIVKECLYDSYDDTRRFAKRLATKRDG